MNFHQKNKEVLTTKNQYTKAPQVVKLLIAKDNNRVERAVIKLAYLENNFQFIFKIEDNVQLLKMLQSVTPDIVIIDIKMQVASDMDKTILLKKPYPTIIITLLHRHDYEVKIKEVSVIKVSSCFISSTSQRKSKTIKKIYEEYVYTTSRINNLFKTYTSSTLETPTKEKKVDDDPFTTLSRTELKILWHVAQYKSMKQVAESLFISPNTVNNHLAKIREKLNLKGTKVLLQYALSIKDKLPN